MENDRPSFNWSNVKPQTLEMKRSEFMAKYPNLTAHMICTSLGYATPSVAAAICLNALRGEQEWCEWVDACYHRDPRLPFLHSIEFRHGHRGFMASFTQAKELVKVAVEESREPIFASWF